MISHSARRKGLGATKFLSTRCQESGFAPFLSFLVFP